MDFGDAIRAMKAGKRVTRSGWNGKRMWVCLIETRDYAVVTRPHGEEVTVKKDSLLPFIAMKTAQANLVPWTASQTDMLADDWQIAG